MTFSTSQKVFTLSPKPTLILPPSAACLKELLSALPSMATDGGDIYSATYSNVRMVSKYDLFNADSGQQVPVYELKLDTDHVMRRRSDDWINATHILKIAGFDKPARTRILEREVQKGVHEKIQGGYGKYQGGKHADRVQSSVLI